MCVLASVFVRVRARTRACVFVCVGGREGSGVCVWGEGRGKEGREGGVRVVRVCVCMRLRTCVGICVFWCKREFVVGDTND